MTPRTPLQRFVAAAIEKAGGPHMVAVDLERLGHRGRGKTYDARTIRTWRSGERTPGADIALALARYYELSLDAYALEEPEEDGRG